MLYVKSVKKMGQIILERIIQPLKRNNFTYQFTKTCKEEKECLKILHGFTKGVIKQRREELKTQGPKEFGVSKKQAFLDLLLQMCEENGGCVLSDDDVQEEVDTFMFEVHEISFSFMRRKRLNNDFRDMIRLLQQYHLLCTVWLLTKTYKRRCEQSSTKFFRVQVEL